MIGPKTKQKGDRHATTQSRQKKSIIKKEEGKGEMITKKGRKGKCSDEEREDTAKTQHDQQKEKEK